MEKKLLFTIIILATIFSSKSEEKENFTFWKDINGEIHLNESDYGLNDSERAEYYYYIGLRNTFYYPDSDDVQLEKLEKYFSPEESNYYSQLFRFCIPGFLAAAAVVVIFIVYLVKRFILKGCRGPKVIVKSYHHTTYFLLISGFLVGVISLSFTMNYSTISNERINNMTNYVAREIVNMTKIYDNMTESQKKFAEIMNAMPDPNVNTEIYGHITIDEEYNNLKTKLENFINDIDSIQKPKFYLQIASLVIFVIVSILGIAGYWIRREYIPWIASIILLIFAVPVFVVAGLDTTYTFLSIDFCATIGNSMISKLIPTENKGLGTYISCPSKNGMTTISTAIYRYIVDFDYLYNQTQTYFENEDWIHDFLLTYHPVQGDKRDNIDFEKLYLNISANLTPSEGTDEDPEIKNKTKEENTRKQNEILRNLKAFQYINHVLAGLLSMTKCYTANNSILYIEEKYCHKNHKNMLFSVIANMVAGLGFIIMAAGLNKLIITMRSHYARALRGKKEFNNDIGDDDYE